MLGALLFTFGKRDLELLFHQPREVDLIRRDGSRHPLLGSLR